MYIHVYTMYWHVFTCIYPKNWKAIESWPPGQSLTRFEKTAYQGSDPGGGKRGPLQEKKSSESVAQRAARARPTQWRLHFCTQSGNVITLCFGYYTSNSRPTEKHPFCHAGLSYCRCLPNSDRNSQLSSFLSPSFELASFPHLHPAIVFLSHPFLAS